MSTKKIGPVLQAWYRWKSLRLPWRKRYLVGLDLQGNTYWEFRLSRGDPTSSPTASDTSPFRRIVHYPRSTHYSEVKVPPQWHQWLRYRRESPPTIREQHEDVARQARMQVLAAQADAKWAAKDSLLDMPKKPENAQPSPASERAEEQKANVESGGTVGNNDQQQTPASPPPSSPKKGAQEDPWKRAATRGGPSESWQPEAWNPSSARKR